MLLTWAAEAHPVHLEEGEGLAVHTRVHTFAASTRDALRHVATCMSPGMMWKSVRQLGFGAFPKLKVAGSNSTKRRHDTSDFLFQPL